MNRRVQRKGEKKRIMAYAAIAAIIAIAALAVVFLSGKNSTNGIQLSTGNTPTYAHLSTAGFALVAPQDVLSGNQRFVALAKEKYDFLYANASDVKGVENASFIVIVVNSTTTQYSQIAMQLVNSTVLDYAVYNTTGIILSRRGVWDQNQTVFILAGYRNSSSLTDALLSFFVRSPVYAPRRMPAMFISANGTKLPPGMSRTGVKDPMLDAYLNGAYELGPGDRALMQNYSYYLNFAYVLYQAPFYDSINPGFSGNASGQGLPYSASMCVPPPPPPDSASMCIGDYIAMPMFQVGSAAPSQPQWSLSSGSCDIFGIDDCIDTTGWAASGLNPQLRFNRVPSVLYGFTYTGSPIPPSLTGTTGPLSSYDPFTWWFYGPGSYGTSTVGVQQNIIAQNQTQVLMDAGVGVFSTPYGETSSGGATTYNESNSTYSCSSSSCGISFNYAIYAAMSESSTIPGSATVISPANFTVQPGTGYYPLFDPVTLSTPKSVRTSAATYYFSYWSVYSSVGVKQYYQRYNTNNATFQIVGPTQAQAVYTRSVAPGNVSVASGFMTPSTLQTCPPPLNCSLPNSGFVPINNVSFTIESANKTITYSNITDSKGRFVTPVLPGGCYDVSAEKDGYSFVILPEPLCVNGRSAVDLIDLSPYVFDIMWPSGYAYGTAPISHSVPLSLRLGYPAGGTASNVSVRASTTSGSINASETTSSNGTATFIWDTGSASGIYDINFTATGLFTPPTTYSVPVVVYSKGYPSPMVSVSLQNSSETLFAGQSFNDQVKVQVCRFSFNPNANITQSCNDAAPFYMSISGIPINTNATFSQNPIPGNALDPNGTTSLGVTVSKLSVPGVYNATVTATVKLSNGTSYSGTAPLMIDLLQPQSCGGDGGISGQVLNRDGSPTPANVTVTSIANDTVVYRAYTGNGQFDTGYSIVPGKYNVTAYSQYGMYIYNSTIINVVSCKILSVVV